MVIKNAYINAANPLTYRGISQFIRVQRAVNSIILPDNLVMNSNVIVGLSLDSKVAQDMNGLVLQYLKKAPENGPFAYDEIPGGNPVYRFHWTAGDCAAVAEYCECPSNSSTTGQNSTRKASLVMNMGYFVLTGSWKFAQQS